MRESVIDVKGCSDGSINITVTNLGIATKNSRKSHTVFCPTLKVLGYSSKNEIDAFKDFEKNLTIFFNVHISQNTLNEALFSFNWTKDNADGLFGANNDSPALKTKNFNLSLGQAA